MIDAPPDPRYLWPASVRHLIDESLVNEIERFTLRFTCDFCAHYMGEREGCAHNWPNRQHTLVPDDQSVGKELVFCKEFDLG